MMRKIIKPRIISTHVPNNHRKSTVLLFKLLFEREKSVLFEREERFFSKFTKEKKKKRKRKEKRKKRKPE